MTVQKGVKTIAEKASYSRVGGMCPRCEGMGQVTDLDLTELYDEDKSLEEGPFLVPGYSAGGWYEKLFASSGFFPVDQADPVLHQASAPRFPVPGAHQGEARRGEYDL